MIWMGKMAYELTKKRLYACDLFFKNYLKYRNLSTVVGLCRACGYCSKRGRVFKTWKK